MPGYLEVDAAALSKVTVPNLVRLIKRVHILPSLYSVSSLTLLVDKRAYLARCGLTFVVLFVSRYVFP